MVRSRGNKEEHIIEKKLKRPYRKVYQPVGWDLFDPKIMAGDEIPPGSVVTVTHHVGPFRWVTDEHGNEMSVLRNSLDPVGRGA